MLKITFINVGYGDSILVEELKGSKRSFSMLLDAGSPLDGMYRKAYKQWPGRIPAFRYLESHEITKLDMLLLSHFHIDHVGGMPIIMEKNSYGEIWSNYSLGESFDFKDHVYREIDNSVAREMQHSLMLLSKTEQLAKASGKELKIVSEPFFSVLLGSEMKLDFYGRDPRLARLTDKLIHTIAMNRSGSETKAALLELDKIQNSAGFALRVSYNGASILFTADLPYSYWNSFMSNKDSLHADILKMPHHGQEDGISQNLAKAISPRYAVFCVSEDNPFGCPAAEIFRKFNEGVKFFATGNIEVLPFLPQQIPHTAVIFEINDSEDIKVKLEPLSSR